MAAEREDMDADARVQLTRMEGKIDLVNERHASMKSDIGKLEERHAADQRRTDERLHVHGNRIQILEADKQTKAGERMGIALSARVLWTLLGGSLIAAAGLIAKLAGAA